jgi:hypothetical protein
MEMQRFLELRGEVSKPWCGPNSEPRRQRAFRRSVFDAKESYTEVRFARERENNAGHAMIAAIFAFEAPAPTRADVSLEHLTTADVIRA